MEILYLKNICKKSIKSAGPRYTPGLDESAPNLEITYLIETIDGLLCNQKFKSRAVELSENIDTSFSSAHKKLKKRYPGKIKKPKMLIDGLREIYELKPAEGKKLFQRLRNSCKQKDKLIEALKDDIYRLERKREKVIKESSESDDKYRYSNDSELEKLKIERNELFKYQDVINDALRFLNSKACALNYKNKLLLTGDWGTGKTHFLCDLSKNLLNSGVPVLFVLAKDFVPHPNVVDALNKYIKNENKFETLLSNFDKLIDNTDSRALIIIDGINESDNDIWKASLSKLSNLVDKYKNIGLILSCRNPFQDYIVNRSNFNDYEQVSHNGFDEIEFDAQTEFFNFYKIPLPEVPLLAEEFSRPLTLKIICQSFNNLSAKEKKKGFSDITSGMKGMTFILESFIKSRSAVIEKKLSLPRGFCWKLIKGYGRYTNNSINGIAPYMAENEVEYISTNKCIEIIKLNSGLSNLSSKEVYNYLIAEGVLIENSIWRPIEEGGPNKITSLPYQRFSDHVIARYILEKYLVTKNINTIKRSFYKNRYLGRLFSTEKPYGSFRNRGIVEAIIIEFPERSKNVLPKDERELYFYLPNKTKDFHAYTEPFSSGLFWRNPNAISRQTDRIVGRMIWSQHEYYVESMFEALLAVSSKIKHPYNAIRLYKNLEKINITSRDLMWTEFIRKSYAGSAVDRIIVWYEKNIPQKLTIRSAKNIIALLSLFLVTTDRVLRNRVTRILTNFGEIYPEALFAWTIESLSINDYYIPERMLASSYGACMSKWDSRSNSAFNKKIIRFSKELIKQIFLPDNKSFNSPHLLIREYALGVIELARYLSPRCVNNKNVKYLNKPYEGIKNIFPHARNIRNNLIQETKYALGMDFGNHTIGYLVKDRAPYDNDNKDYKNIKKQIQWRIHKLGYVRERFEIIDNQISERGVYKENNAGKIDRYGKKYSWIAYYEMCGILDSLGKIDSGEKLDRNYYFDIDPSFPKYPEKLNINVNNYFKKTPVKSKDWLIKGPEIDFQGLLQLKYKTNKKYDWILLNGHFHYTDSTSSRGYMSFIRSFLIDKTNLERFKKEYYNTEYVDHSLSDTSGNDNCFYGEIPWSKNFAYYLKNKNGKYKKNQNKVFSKSRLVRKKVRLKKAWEILYLNIEDVNRKINKLNELSRDNNVVNYRKKHRKIVDEINCLLCVINEGQNDKDCIEYWELFQNPPSLMDVLIGYRYENVYVDMGGINAQPTWWSHQCNGYDEGFKNLRYFVIPHPLICNSLNLRMKHRSVDMINQKQEKVSLYREEGGHFKNTHNVCYLRKDILNKYCMDNNKKFIWTIWGERQMDYDMFHRENEIQEIYQQHLHSFRKIIEY
jgi:DNA replication protein DnaC